MADAAEIIQFPERRDDAQSPGPSRPGRSPQVEDGFTRIANELFEGIIGASLTDRERRVVLAIVRLTYGWNRKADRVYAEDIAKLTRLHESRCSKVISELVRRNVIHRQGGSRSPLTLNKNLDSWEASTGSKRQAPTKRAESAQNEPVKPAQNEPTYKDRKDNTLTTFGCGASDDSPDLELTPPDEPPTPKGKAQKPTAYTDAFERAWSAYPKRAGSNPKKPAFACWNARLAEGNEPDDMIAAVERYAAYVRAKGDERTEFVMQAQRFFGVNAEFDNEWTPPGARKPVRQDGRLGMAQPLPVGSYTPTDMDNLPAWMRD